MGPPDGKTKARHTKAQSKIVLGVVAAFVVVYAVVKKRPEEKVVEPPPVALAPPPLATTPADASATSEEIDVPIAATRAARDAFVSQLNAKMSKHRELTFRGAVGEPDTEFVVEMIDTNYACDVELVKSIVDNLGVPLRSGGFKRVACNGVKIAIDLDGKPMIPADAAPPEAAPPDAPAVVLLAAPKLFADYRDNEIAADAKYRGKLMRITGSVRKIAKDIRGKPYVMLAAGNLAEVQAVLDDEKDVADRKRGDEVRLLCQGAGTIFGTPQLDHCELEAHR